MIDLRKRGKGRERALPPDPEPCALTFATVSQSSCSLSPPGHKKKRPATGGAFAALRRKRGGGRLAGMVS